MLKINKLFLTLSAVAVSVCGCRLIPDGTPPEHTVEIRETAEDNEPVLLSEALNMMSTELAVKVFSKFKGELRILFKNNAAGDNVTRKLYYELKMFLPVVSVLNGEDFVIESSFREIDRLKKVWYLRLKERSGRIIWSDSAVIKNEAESEKNAEL